MTVFTKEQFDVALRSWLIGAQEKVRIGHIRFPNIPVPLLTFEFGQKYIRVVRSDGSSSRSVHCFIDMTDGNVLKSASWKSPAKHARGNIFNSDNGLGCMNEYGTNYLR